MAGNNDKISLTQREDVFIKKVFSLIDEHIDNEKFGMEDLADLLNLSRSQLHRKVRHLTGLPVSRLIRKMRLEKARMLLEKEGLNVKEVTYSVGFSSVSYFIKCYHDHFGYAPGNEMKKNIRTISRSEVLDYIFGNGDKKRSARWKVMGLVVLAGIISLFIILTPLGKSAQVEKSVAVLPLNDLNENAEFQYVADGIQDAVAGHLSKLAGLRVIPCSFVEQYRRSPKPPGEIGNELRVGYLITGSFQKLDEIIRIRLWLIDTKSAKQIWFREYEKGWKDIFLAQSEIASDIAGAIEVTVSGSQKNVINEIPTQNITAYDYYMRGREEFFKWFSEGRPDNLENAILLYKKALKLDSNYAEAFSSLAFAINNKYFGNPDYKKICGDTVLFLVNKALKLNDRLEEAYLIRSNYHTSANGDWESSNEDLNKALHINPNYGPAYYGKGIVELEYFGNTLEAVKNLVKAIDMEFQYITWKPLYYMWLGHAFYDAGYEEASKDSFRKAFELHNDTLLYYWNTSELYIGLGDHENAVLWNLKCLTRDSANAAYYQRLIVNYTMMRKYTEAYECLLKYIQLTGRYDSGWLYYSYTIWKSGNKKEALDCFNYRLGNCEKSISSGADINMDFYVYFDYTAINAVLENYEESFRYLKEWEKKKVFYSYDLTLIQKCPMLDNIRNDKRFVKVLRAAENKYIKQHERVGEWLRENNM